MASDTSLVFNLVARDRASQVVAGMKEKISTAAAGIGAAVGAAMGYGVTNALDVEAANDKLAAQLLLSEDESERIGEVAGGLYADAYGGSMEEVNAAVGSVMSSIKGMSEASSADLQTASEEALNFASTFDIDVNRAVQSVGTAINSGLAKDSTEAFDLITAASSKVPASLREDVLDASDEYGQFFNTLGYGGEQAFAVLVDASAKGTFGIDKAGDAIKEFTIRATDMSTGSQAAYKAIGLDAHKMANAILAGGDQAQGATQKIIDGLLKIKDPAKQANTAIALFGTPLEDMNVEEIPQFLQSLKGASGSMDDFGGAAKRSGDALNSNAKTAFTSFKRSVEMNLTEVGGKLAQFAMDHQTVVKPLAITLAGLAATVLAVRAGMMVWTAAQALWTAATAVATAVQWAYNAALLANPYTWIILAILALVAAVVVLWKKNDAFRAFIQSSWALIWGAIKKVWDWVKNNWPLVLGMLTGPIGLAVGAIINYWDRIIGFVKDLPGKIGRAASGMWNGVVDSFKWAINQIIWGWNSLSFTIGGGSFMGVSIPSLTLGTPNIPYLAKGGIIQSAGMAVVGERGPELVHLSRGAQVTPLTRGGGGGQTHILFEIVGGSRAFREFFQESVRITAGGDVIKFAGG
ncbi:phage tail tape measure protein [Streptomyces sp. bgisy154]|uniref:phage tail tape measure protein n=1 Tax=Streptomyces sp. bgisy154 TaxID=3413794 RepID=UPI003D7630AE